MADPMRYVPVAKIPEILASIKGATDAPYQSNAWQVEHCSLRTEPIQGAAVLSYRWRTGAAKGTSETYADFQQWLDDCRDQGYSVPDLRGMEDVDFSVLDGCPLQIELAAWLLWVHATGAAEYVWVDQMCVPQDADLAIKMGHVRESLGIYSAGTVYILLSPVVDGASGRIVTQAVAEELVAGYNAQMDQCDVDFFAQYITWRFADQYETPPEGKAWWMSRAAVKGLMVNNSYMRRAWTIQEAYASKDDLSSWPLLGKGDLSAYQPLMVVDWPEFNAWGQSPQLAQMNDQKCDDAAEQGYWEGNYTGVLRELRAKSDWGMGYLNLAARGILWATMSRNGLVNSLHEAASIEERAWLVLNHEGTLASRCFNADDKVLALAPLVDYDAWLAATQGVAPEQVVQASVDWAYGLIAPVLAPSAEFENKTWAMRIFNNPTVPAQGLGSLAPRRNLTEVSAVYGKEPKTLLPPAGNDITLDGRKLRVEASLVLPHAGNANNWGENCWKFVRDAIKTNETFRLSLEWTLSDWRLQGALDAANCAVYVLTEEGAPLVLLALFAVRKTSTGEVPKLTEGEDAVLQLMQMLDVKAAYLGDMVAALKEQAVGPIGHTCTVLADAAVDPGSGPEVVPAGGARVAGGPCICQ